MQHCEQELGPYGCCPWHVVAATASTPHRYRHGSPLVERRAFALLPVPLQVHPAGLRHPVRRRAPAQMVERLLPLLPEVMVQRSSDMLQLCKEE